MKTLWLVVSASALTLSCVHNGSAQHETREFDVLRGDRAGIVLAIPDRCTLSQKARLIGVYAVDCGNNNLLRVWIAHDISEANLWQGTEASFTSRALQGKQRRWGVPGLMYRGAYVAVPSTMFDEQLPQLYLFMEYLSATPLQAAEFDGIIDSIRVKAGRQ